MSRQILLLSQDPDFCVLLCHVLASGGYATRVISSTEEIGDLDYRWIDAVLVDSHKELQPTLALCRDFRVRPDTSELPIIALIRACNEHHFLELVQAGVTECLVRPVSPDMIMACLRVALGAGRDTGEPLPKDVLAVGNLQLHHASRALRSASAAVQLSPTEYRLLRHLVMNSGRVASRSELVAAAWPAGIHVEARTVDVHMGRLRRQLEQASGRKMIRTIRSAGFIFDG